jgi:hypothetical protein
MAYVGNVVDGVLRNCDEEQLPEEEVRIFLAALD